MYLLKVAHIGRGKLLYMYAHLDAQSKPLWSILRFIV